MFMDIAMLVENQVAGVWESRHFPVNRKWHFGGQVGQGIEHFPHGATEF
jgi:hypothetical protein